MKPIALIIPALLLCFCSGKQKTASDAIRTDTTLQTSTAPASIDYRLTSLKDTTVNGISLGFHALKPKQFDSLMHFTVNLNLTLEKFDNLVSRINNCQLIKLQNGIDSLCDKNDPSGYFEKYEIEGFWKAKNQLLANFQDWEGGGDYLINLKNGSHYYLNTNYEISPSSNFILGYNADNTIPIYGNEFIYTEISRDSAKLIFNIDLGQVAITSLKWLTDNQCLVSSSIQYVDAGEFKLKDPRYYKMTIKR